MCRMLSAISVKPLNLTNYLVDSEKSLLKQSNAVRKRFQADGWGMGCFAGNKKLRIFKSKMPAFHEKKKFLDKANSANSKIIMAHIRNASNPKNLARQEILGNKNCQPFVHSNFMFAHNGTIEIPDEIKNFLGTYKKFVKGNNDSEIFFFEILKHLDAYGNMELALESVIDEIWTIWRSCKNKYHGKTTPYRGLNAFVSDGSSLHVLCHYPLKKDPKALMSRNWEWGRIAYRLGNGAAVFASEPPDNGKWKKMNDLQIISMTLKNGSLDFKVKNIKLNKGK